MVRRVVAAVLILVASLLAPFAVGALWAERTITDPVAFNETLAPLAEDPIVRQTVSTEVSSAIIDAVDAEARAEKALGGLDGIFGNLQPVESGIASAIAAGVNNAITSGVDSYVNSDRFGDGWLAVSSVLQEQFVALLERDAQSSAVRLNDGQVVLNTKVALEKVQAELATRDVPFAGTLSIPGRDIVLADAPNLQLVADALSVFLPVAAWLWAVVLLVFVIGILLWRPRSRGLLWTGIGLAIGAVVTYAGLNLGTAQIADAAPVGFGALVGTVVDTLLRFLINALLVMLSLGVALAVAGWLGGATASGRRVRLAIAGAAHRWGGPLADDRIGRYTSEHPMFVPTLRAVVLVGAGAYLLLADRLSPAEILFTALAVAVALLAVEVVEGSGLAYEDQHAGALVARATDPEPEPAE